MNPNLPDIANWMIQFGTSHEYLVYGAIMAIACAEGPWISLILGVVIRLGYFAFWPVYLSLMIGDLVGDVIWYFVGRRYGHVFIKKYGKRFGITEAGVEKMAAKFRKHKHSVLFASKISNGLGFALITLMTAGMIRIPFGRYLLINALGQLIWTGFLIGVGFFFSHLYVTVDSVLGKMSIVAVVIVAIALVYKYVGTMRKRSQAAAIAEESAASAKLEGK